MKNLSIIFFTIIFFFSSTYASSEKILKFSSDITINPDASIIVTETIEVQANGEQIKHGIFRDIPIKLDILDIERNGIPEPYNQHVAKIFIGSPEVFLAPGVYSYSITYKANRQIRYFDKFDELYWNVTGNGWDFPIDQATANIHLPQGASVIQQAAYTGPLGANDQNYTENNLIFTTTKPLAPHEGFTIAVAWPKGFVKQPFNYERLSPYLILLLAAYCFIIWYKVVRGPHRGTIIPLFFPPKDLSPAKANYITYKGRSDNKGFAATLVDMAIKKCLKITEVNKIFVLEKIKQEKIPLFSEEQIINDRLFIDREKLALEQSNHILIGSTLNEFNNKLKQECFGTLFVSNLKYLIPALLISLSALLIITNTPATGFLMVWLGIWTLGCVALASYIISVWKSVFFGSKYLAAAIGITVFSIFFFAAEIFVITKLAMLSSALTVLLLFIILVIDIIFYSTLRTWTPKGREIMDQIEGFKMYLSVAEQERYKILNPPQITPELFEKYLPYALALGIEHEWSENFANNVGRSVVESYSPYWYYGSSFYPTNMTAFASSLGGSLTGAISISSHAPSSSSGSSGSGSSGGGSGGGGGGGW